MAELGGHLAVTPARGHSCAVRMGVLKAKASPEVIPSQPLMSSEFAWVAAASSE